MSSEKFEDHEDEFRSYFEDLQNTLKNKIPRLNGEPRKRELRNAEKSLEDADIQLTQMIEEAQAAPGAYRTSLMSKTRGYKAQLDKTRRELSKATTSTTNLVGGRDDLLGTSTERDDPNVAQRNKMLQGLESLDRGSHSVARSQRIAAETDEVGVQIIGDLDDQRESLIRTRDKVKQTDADLGRSRRILNSIAIRIATNKILLVVVIIIELAIIGAVVYIRFIK